MIRWFFFPRICRKTICTSVDYNIRKHSRKPVRMEVITERSFACYAIRVTSATVNSFPRDPCKVLLQDQELYIFSYPIYSDEEARKSQTVESCVNLLATDSLCKRTSPLKKKTKWWNHCHLCSGGHGGSMWEIPAMELDMPVQREMSTEKAATSELVCF